MENALRNFRVPPTAKTNRTRLGSIVSTVTLADTAASMSSLVEKDSSTIQHVIYCSEVADNCLKNGIRTGLTEISTSNVELIFPFVKSTAAI